MGRKICKTYIPHITFVIRVTARGAWLKCWTVFEMLIHQNKRQSLNIRIREQKWTYFIQVTGSCERIHSPKYMRKRALRSMSTFRTLRFLQNIATLFTTEIMVHLNKMLLASQRQASRVVRKMEYVRKQHLLFLFVSGCVSRAAMLLMKATDSGQRSTKMKSSSSVFT